MPPGKRNYVQMKGCFYQLTVNLGKDSRTGYMQLLQGEKKLQAVCWYTGWSGILAH